MKKNLTWTSRHRRGVKFASSGKSSGFSGVQSDSKGATALQPFAQTFSFRFEHGFENGAALGRGFIQLAPDHHERQTFRHGWDHGGALDGVSVNRKRGNREEEEEERKRDGEYGHCLIRCCFITRLITKRDEKCVRICEGGGGYLYSSEVRSPVKTV